MLTLVSRRKDQDGRRRQLEQAARRVIAERGVLGTRVKDVAAEAGLSSQSVLYYFPEFDELIVQAIQHTLERFAERRSQAADGIDDPCLALVTTIRSGLPTGPDDQDLRILYDAASYFGDNPTLGALMRSTTARQIEMYRRLLELGEARGVFTLADDSAALARNLVALEDAYGLYIVGGAPILDEAARQILSFAAIATGCPSLRELAIE